MITVGKIYLQRSWKLKNDYTECTPVTTNTNTRQWCWSDVISCKTMLKMEMTSKTAEITQSKCSVKNQQYVQWCKTVDSKNSYQNQLKSTLWKSIRVNINTNICVRIWIVKPHKNGNVAYTMRFDKKKTVKMCTQWWMKARTH